MNFHYTVPGDDFSRAGNASAEIKKALQRLGIPQQTIKRTAVAMYEAEMNMAVHAGGGEAEITIDADKITIVMRDTGPGIENLDLAMKDGWSSASGTIRDLGFGAGMGLPNMKKNSDELVIDTAPGKGTTVTMVIRIERTNG